MPLRLAVRLAAGAVVALGLTGAPRIASAQALGAPLAVPDEAAAGESGSAGEDPILTTCKACGGAEAQAKARAECAGEPAGRAVWVIDAGAYTVHAFACTAGADAAAVPLPKEAAEGMASLRALEDDLRAALTAGGLDPDAAAPNVFDGKP